ncbi:hypothetical protein K432DRAFT_404149 [Lepidopterella palustris CBS 459.81]|uniref:Uncharacterized protein n=1 Tax=Lepidopterella palustris CBS 459.81 TaxID=1314670 RepID=A0A8E2EBS3_9PEZI|nr:hypothetical protein K432DRAFT_404149 [Lepidopterella palustris CBS 459.81]
MAGSPINLPSAATPSLPTTAGASKHSATPIENDTANAIWTTSLENIVQYERSKTASPALIASLTPSTSPRDVPWSSTARAPRPWISCNSPPNKWGSRAGRYCGHATNTHHYMIMPKKLSLYIDNIPPENTGRKKSMGSFLNYEMRCPDRAVENCNFCKGAAVALGVVGWAFAPFGDGKEGQFDTSALKAAMESTSLSPGELQHTFQLEAPEIKPAADTSPNSPASPIPSDTSRNKSSNNNNLSRILGRYTNPRSHRRYTISPSTSIRYAI